ncbi:Membrane-associated phospholipid phosphatase [Nocardioides exalbidus]|uniref:Membrane-associated phospholipid phosphatase n=1 Tax=Nocardioides exalbidus TaxID=402596 RepID=A0A1H4QHX6_9ACTN|nr:phosphatase PAP2 family protein [Nocardioides exalbidus]SEC19181.1 Membrane-associated phospholipid phosphatase [Nocardioides exalbidus]
MDISARTRHAARTLTIAWIVLLLAVLAVGWLLTHPLESSVDPWDDSVSRWIAERRTPDGELLAAWGSHVADTVVGVALAAVSALVLWRVQRTRLPLVYFTVLVAGTLALYLVVTTLITRDRPPVEILDPGLVPDHSFPSGHVATSIVVYCALAIYLFRTVPGSRRWAWILFLAPVVVAPSRLYEGAHHVTDVVTSLVFAPLWVAVVARALLPDKVDA